MNFSEQSLLLNYEFASKFPVLIDVGAHYGSISKMFADKGWAVIAFEANYTNYQKFIEILSGYEKVKCIPKAVSNITGSKVPFYVSTEHYGIHSLKPWHDTHEKAYEIETTRLDDALAELQCKQVDFLKIDIEGADFLALQSFDFKVYKPQVIMVEFMDERTKPHFNYSYHDVVAYMENLGYVAFISEWAPIAEYGRATDTKCHHQWLGLFRYPLDHEPEWGNILFVPKGDEQNFINYSALYLKKLNFLQSIVFLRPFVRRIPGAKLLYRWLGLPEHVMN